MLPRTFFSSLLLSLGATLSPALAQTPEPPIWVLSDEDSTIYMIGTVHVMRDGVEWKSTAVADALEQADEIWLEVPDLTPPDSMGGMIMRLGMSPDRPLSSLLSEAEMADLEAILDEHEMPVESFDGLRPWFAYLQITSLVLLDAGFSPEGGIDVRIQEAARKSGTPIKGFESFEEQFEMLSGMPEQVQLDVLRQTIVDYQEAKDDLDVQLESWIEGDLSALEDETMEIAEELPGFYDILFVERNERFADGIEEILEGEGVTLVAVGLGHFVGPDSIPQILEDRGYSVEQR